jgi:hypothetical protein
MLAIVLDLSTTMAAKFTKIGLCGVPWLLSAARFWLTASNATPECHPGTAAINSAIVHESPSRFQGSFFFQFRPNTTGTQHHVSCLLLIKNRSLLLRAGHNPISEASQNP